MRHDAGADLPKTIPYHLMERIRERIIDGSHPPGLFLREQELEAEYATSRGPVREALRLLELKGLVVHSPRRGFRVKEYSDKAIRDIYHLRARVESFAVECLAGKDLRPLVAALEKSNRRMERFFTAREITGYLRENAAFHGLIADYSGSEALARVLELLNEMAQPIRYAFLSRSFSRSRTYRYHREITERLAKNDLETAMRLTEEHILHKLDEIQEAYRKHVARGRRVRLGGGPRAARKGQPGPRRAAR